MSEKEAFPDECTREKLFPLPVTGSKGPDLSEVCRKLLEEAAKRLKNLLDRGIHGRTKKVLIEYQSDLYCYLMSLHLMEKESGKKLKTLTDALSSPETLKKRFLLWLKDNGSGYSPGSQKRGDPLRVFNETGNATHSQPWAYYRNRFLQTLREKGRIVQPVGRDYFFTYGSRELDCLPRSDFQARLDELASSFKPPLSDQDFWQGEEPIYTNGNIGKHEGPGMKELDSFCEQLFLHVSTIFGRPYLISLNMIGDILPKCYTYFEEKIPLALSPSPGENNKAPGEIAEQRIPGERTWEAEKLLLCSFFENNRERIRSAVRQLNLTEALIICGIYNDIPQTSICSCIGQKSSGRMMEKFGKASQKLFAILEKEALRPDMYRFCDKDDGVRVLDEYYRTAVLSFCWQEWKADTAHLLGIDTSQETEKWD